MRLNLFAITILLFSLPTASLADALTECNNIANEYNKSMPMQIDKITKATSIICVLGSKKHTILYSYTVDMDYSNSIVNAINGTKSRTVGTWCTSPNLRNLLTFYDAKFKYVDKVGKYITAINISSIDCK